MTARSTARTGPDPARRQRVRDLLAPVVEAAGAELEDVELRTVGRRLVLRVFVDTASGISLDEVAAASQAVSDALDSSDVLGDDPYTLEVSSPGIDRPLTEPRHWQRNLGRLVAVTLTDGSVLTARVVAVDGSAVELEESVKGRATRRTLALADVARAVVEVEFSRSASSGAPGVDQVPDDDDVDDLDDLDDLEELADDTDELETDERG